MRFTLGRLPYGLIVAGLFVLMVGVNVAGLVFRLPIGPVAKFWWAPLLILTVATVARLRDVRWSAWWAAICIIPLAGFILGAVLCTRPSAAA